MRDSASPHFGPQLESLLGRAARCLASSRRTVALTGAGLSAESGIPPFRRGTGGSAGLWERYDPLEYGTIEAFDQNPARVWIMLRELAAPLEGARPNAGHEALARMEASGLLSAVITQNIDGLHQAAGSRRVLELHGSWRTLSCRLCGMRFDSRRVTLERLPPLCECGGPLKPDVTMFGEIVPAPVIDAAWDEVRSCDCLLVIGTTAEVTPAATLPAAARDYGATIIEVNIGPTNLTTTVVDLCLIGPAGIILPRLAREAGVGLES